MKPQKSFEYEDSFFISGLFFLSVLEPYVSDLVVFDETMYPLVK